jgi:hypothetical protein
MKKNKEKKADKNIKTNDRINKDKTKQKTETNNNNNKNEKDTIIKSLNIQISNLKHLIETKNKEIESLKVDNKKKDLLLINYENKIEKLKKKLDLIKVRNDILVKNTNEKDLQIFELNNSLDEIKHKKTPDSQKDIPANQIKEGGGNDNNNNEKVKENMEDKIAKDNSKENNDKNLMEKIEKYEIELNKIKNNLDESEINNSKLTFENNILVDKIKNIEKEKTEEIKILKTLHQKEIDNCNKNISQLNEKIIKLINEEEKNKNNNMNKNEDEYISKESVINELNKKENKIRELDEMNFQYKKEIQDIISKNEELKIICDNKEKIIKKLEDEIDAMDMNNPDHGRNTKRDKDNEDMNDIEFIKKENEELKIGLHNMTEGINEANKLLNEKLNNFKEQVNLKNIKINEYKNKILFLKNKINELYNELNLHRGERVSKNSYYNASFINNSIINTSSVPKYSEDNYNINNALMINKNNSKVNYGNNKKNIISEQKFYDTGNNPKKIIDKQYNNNYGNINTTVNLMPVKNKEKRKIKKNRTDKQFTETQDFINKNEEEDKAHINFLNEYKEILNKFNDFNFNV